MFTKAAAPRGRGKDNKSFKFIIFAFIFYDLGNVQWAYWTVKAGLFGSINLFWTINSLNSIKYLKFINKT